MKDIVIAELGDEEFLEHIREKMREISVYTVEEITRLCSMAEEAVPPFMPQKIEYKGETLKHIYKKALAKIKE